MRVHVRRGHQRDMKAIPKEECLPGKGCRRSWRLHEPTATLPTGRPAFVLAQDVHLYFNDLFMASFNCSRYNSLHKPRPPACKHYFHRSYPCCCCCCRRPAAAAAVAAPLLLMMMLMHLLVHLLLLMLPLRPTCSRPVATGRMTIVQEYSH